MVTDQLWHSLYIAMITKYGYQVRVSIVFYQRRYTRKFSLWLQEQLHTGYIRRRRDGMSEYTIVGLSAVASVLTLLQSKLRLKKQLAQSIETDQSSSGKDDAAVASKISRIG